MKYCFGKLVLLKLNINLEMKLEYNFTQKTYLEIY